MKSKFLDLRDSPPDPKIAAAAGPLALKEPGSEPWIIQITHKAQGILVSLDRDTNEWIEVIDQIDTQRVWEKYPKEKPYGTRDAYYKSEFGQIEPKLTRLKIDQQLSKHGGQPGNQNAKKEKNDSDNIRVVSLGEKGGTSSEYIRARLERDSHDEERPHAERERKAELLMKVERGELSAHAAAIEAGWRTRMVQVPATVDGFRRAIERHLSAEQQTELSLALRPTHPEAS